MPRKNAPPTGLALFCVLLPLWGFVPPLLVGVNPFAGFGDQLNWLVLGEACLLFGAIFLFLGRRWGWTLVLIGLLVKAIPAALDVFALFASDAKVEPYLAFAEGFRLGGWVLMFAWAWLPDVQRYTRRD